MVDWIQARPPRTETAQEASKLLQPVTARNPNSYTVLDTINLILLLVLIAIVCYWLNSISVLEISRNAAKNVCAKVEVQLLDDTVACVGIKLVRDKAGRRVLRRTYRFEFSETGNTRIEGQVVMVGNSVESVTMDPYQLQE